MKTWRWLLAFMVVGTIVVACGDDPAKRETEETNAGGNSNTTTNPTTTMPTGTTTTTAPPSCNNEPDFGTCAQCHCDANVNECNAYLTALINNIYCGQTCGAGACATFCADPNNNMLDMPCSDCANAIMDPNVDIDNFAADCQADANCVGFAQILQGCP